MKKIALLVCLVCFFIPSVNAQVFWEGERAGVCRICAELEKKGFPESYREPLCALQLMHPQWCFEAREITALSRQAGKEYTFDAVLEQETVVPSRSLVVSSEAFSPYRHASGERYDSGFYRASPEAVAFFTDPRGFLSEKGIFQFLTLNFRQMLTKEHVEQVLSGSEISSLYSAEDLFEAGKAAGMDPVYLAVRLHQEQGDSGNALFWGDTGSILKDWFERKVQWEDGRMICAPETGYSVGELLRLNGFFNPLNISAGGNGYFQILYNGASHAKEMGWNTPEKGLAGGIEKISREYLANYQDTLYFQKWNVDPRSVTEEGGSRNFWGQYMQNISAAKTEGDALFEVYRDKNLLSLPLTFSIPVYEGLPNGLSPDPALGTCPVTRQDHLPESRHDILPEEEVFPSFPEAEEEGSVDSMTEFPKENSTPKKGMVSVFWLALLFFATLLFCFLQYFLLIWLPTVLRKKSNFWKN